jgi:hypothetical protein
MNSWVIPRTVTVPIGSWKITNGPSSYSKTYVSITLTTTLSAAYGNSWNGMEWVPNNSFSFTSEIPDTNNLGSTTIYGVTSGYNEPATASANVFSSFVTSAASATITVTTSSAASSTSVGGGFFGYGGSTLAPRKVTTTAITSGTGTGTLTYPSTTVLTTSSAVTSTTTATKAATSVTGPSMTTLSWARGQTTVYDSYYNSAYANGRDNVFFIPNAASSPAPVATSAAGSTVSGSYSKSGSANVVSYSVPYVTGAGVVVTVTETDYGVTTAAGPLKDVLYYTEPSQYTSFPNETYDGWLAGMDITTSWDFNSTVSEYQSENEIGYHVSSSSAVVVSTTSKLTTVLPKWGGFQTVEVPYKTFSTTASRIASAPVNTGSSDGSMEETRLIWTSPTRSSFYGIELGPFPSAGFSYPQERMAHYTDTGTSAGVTLSANPSVSNIPISQFGQWSRYAPLLEPPASAFITTISANATGTNTGTIQKSTTVSFNTGGETTTLWGSAGGGFGNTSNLFTSSITVTQLGAGREWQVGLLNAIYRTAVGSSTGTSLYSAQIVSSSSPSAAVTQFRQAPQGVCTRFFDTVAEVQELAPSPIQPPLKPAVFTWSVTPGY